MEAQVSRHFMRCLTWQASGTRKDGQERLTSNDKMQVNSRKARAECNEVDGSITYLRGCADVPPDLGEMLAGGGKERASSGLSRRSRMLKENRKG